MRTATSPSKPFKVYCISTIHLFGFIFRTASFCTVCEEKVAAATTVAGKDAEDIGVCGYHSTASHNDLFEVKHSQRFPSEIFSSKFIM